MKHLLTGIIVVGLLAFSHQTQAAEVGKPAPEFKLKDAQGKEVSLSSFKGKTVVLEWVNFDCPFVKKFYSANEMQKLQVDYTSKGVIWLSVCSSAPGKQGNFAPAEISKRIEASKAKMSAYLIDETGAVGKLYGAKTTPHMFIIAPDGTLAYAGGIDNVKSVDSADIPKAENYVKKALDEILLGKAVSTSTSAPYGCGVKY